MIAVAVLVISTGPQTEKGELKVNCMPGVWEENVY